MKKAFKLLIYGLTFSVFLTACAGGGAMSDLEASLNDVPANGSTTSITDAETQTDVSQTESQTNFVTTTTEGATVTNPEKTTVSKTDSNSNNSSNRTTAKTTQKTTREKSDKTSTTGCAHIYKEEIELEAKPLVDGRARYTCSTCKHSYTGAIPATKTLKVLAVGNSFSEDATYYLWQICHDAGVEKIVVGNMYIGGCALHQHAANISQSSNDYRYDKNVSGIWSSRNNVSIQTAMKDEAWDIITIQQVSGLSGVEDSYQALPNVLKLLVKLKPAGARILWHQTWAYDEGSWHGDFAKYQSDQITMYNSIVDVLKSVVLKDSRIDGFIPAGTAIQNLRTSNIPDSQITRDSYHLNFGLGRYVAAMTWYSVLTGGPVDKVDWTPSNYAEIASNLPTIRKAVANAIKTPYSVTNV